MKKVTIMILATLIVLCLTACQQSIPSQLQFSEINELLNQIVTEEFDQVIIPTEFHSVTEPEYASVDLEI